MATTKKSLTARVVAGVGAVAIATLTALGGTLPASAAGPNIVQPTDGGTISIHKFEQPIERGDVATGDLMPTDGLTPVPNVAFRVQQVLGYNVFDSEDWDDIVGLTVVDVNPATDLDQPIELRTTATGDAIFTGLDLGVYYVQEFGQTAPDAGNNQVIIPAEPFLVVIPQANDGSWLYNVHVYPKNTVTNVTKQVEAFSQAGLGETLTWTITSPVPVVATEGTLLKSYAVTDDLDNRLNLDGAAVDAVTVSVDGAALLEGVDYTVSEPIGADRTVTVTFVSGGLEKLSAGEGGDVVVAIDTVVARVDADAAGGTISNMATVLVNEFEVDSTIDTAYYGGVEFQKVDDQVEAQPLAGAIFQVLLDDESYLLGSDGQPVQFSSDPQGMVTIPGLRTNAQGNQTYRVVEVQAPSGYVLPENEADRTWTVQVPLGVTELFELDDIVNVQVSGYMLPITGGAGQAAFMIGGAGLLAGALGFMLIRRRKDKAEAQA